MDLSKLTPAPWGVHDGGRDDHTICRENGDDTCQPLFVRCGPPGLTDAEFICLARAAFDVMTRRGWGVVQRSSGWFAVIPGIEPMVEFRKMRFPDPFTALVESDEWYRDNVEGER